jgi:predicted lipoprotein with Yx(FWY)xxD motif
MVIPHEGGKSMTRLITAGTAIAATLTLGACGGGSGNSSGGAASAAGSKTGSKTVSVRQLSGVGRVLVDRSGKALYSPDQEAGGRTICDSACTAFWKPLSPGAGTPTAAPGAGKLGVIKRPDGSMQVTANRKPLYTFSEDSPGKATGDGFTDDFSGHHFLWHVVGSAGKAASTGSGNSGESAPGSNTSPSSGGHGGY